MKAIYIVLFVYLLVGCSNEQNTRTVSSPAPICVANDSSFYGDAINFPTSNTGTTSGLVRISLHGDSIFKGIGMGDYSHPSALNSVGRVLAELLAPGQVEVRIGGQTADSVWYDVAAGKIKDGDIVVFENAGPHFNDTEMYRMWLTLFHKAATWDSRNNKALNSRVFLTTTFDYVNHGDLYNSEYDVPVNGGHTINEVIKQVGVNTGAPVLDWNAIMDDLVSRESSIGVHFMSTDLIHANAFGNLVMAFSIYSQFAPLATMDRTLLIAELQKYDSEMRSKGFLISANVDYDAVLTAIINTLH